MITKIAILMAVVCLVTAHAGEVQVVGFGQAEAKPDAFVMLLKVHSYCFENPSDSLAQNEKYSGQVAAIFENYKTSDRDRITLMNHRTIRESGKTCNQKWHSTATLKIYHEGIDKASALRVALVNYAGKISKGDPTKGTLTLAEVFEPGYELRSDQFKATRAKADELALDDAMKQFLYIKGRCGMKNVKMLSATQSYESRPEGKQLTNEAFDSVLQHENVKVRAKWNVKWEFESVATCK